ncbi:MAG TPA: tRNA pseudouridine(38-40) synthase TruA [Candidatus Eisenbacteria bacterium]|nr:tRNA pseudouridine(38-40) synthase TruA [Candidatus Eisenbacteria bacterium]
MASERPERRAASFRLAVEYDGTAFHGWQRQSRARTVQGELEAALTRITGEPSRVTGAGRTDAGCHAAGQVASVTVTTRLDARRLQGALNAHLPRDVRVVEAAETPASFHARFQATRRAYRYLIVPAPSAIRRAQAWVRDVRADAAGLERASRALLGSHDFLSFSKASPDTESTRCTVARARWSGRGGRLRFDIEADRFLYTMVRRIVATVVRETESGRGAAAVRAVLDAKDRRAAAPPAPAHGLYLMRVRYPRIGWIPRGRMHVVG